jgi:hypothetical protein
MMHCYEDHSGVDRDDLRADLVGAWNKRAAEAAAFRRGVEAMRKAARAEMNRLYFAEAEPTQQAYDRQDAFHCADRAIAAMPPPEDTP